MRKLFTGVTLLGLAFAAVIASAQNRPGTAEERLISALLPVNFENIYADDGMADGTVTDAGTVTARYGDKAYAKVRQIIALGPRAIPLLIEHVDDARPSKTLFNGRPVPMGHIALDILIHVAGDNSRIYIADCADDGLGACLEPAYYFRPDAKRDEMRRVKHNWKRLYRSGAVSFYAP
jgi:hypothetical protein